MQLVLSLAPGGTERLVIDLCRRLADRVDTVVCCLDEPGAWAAEVTALNIPVVSLSRQPGFHPSLSVRLGEALKAHDVDVIHCHHYSPYVYGVLAAMLNPSVRIVFTEHGRLHGAGISTKRRLVNPVLSRWPARIFAVSASLKQDMVAEGFPQRSIDVLYNGIELGPRPLAPVAPIASLDSTSIATRIQPGSISWSASMNARTLPRARAAPILRSSATDAAAVVTTMAPASSPAWREPSLDSLSTTITSMRSRG